MPLRLNNIQALRAFAALLVVFGHTGLRLGPLGGFGTFGVDVFFVISGFIMAMIVDRNPERFFLRRVIRIVPLYWAATLGVYSLALAAPALMKNTTSSPRDLLLSLLFIPFFKGSSGAANPVLFVGWTLNYEMYFYVLLALCLRVTRRHATLAVSALLAVLMVCCWTLGRRYAFSAMYGEPQVLEFVMGIAVYRAVRRTTEARAQALRPLSALLLVAAAAALIVLEGRAIWPTLPGDWARPVTWGLPSLCLVWSAAMLARGGWDTRLRWLVLLGDASYVIYILHTYVLDGFGRVMSRRVPWLGPDRPAGCVLSVMAVAALSVAVYLYAERPVVNWLSARAGTRRIRKPEVGEPAESIA